MIHQLLTFYTNFYGKCRDDRMVLQVEAKIIPHLGSIRRLPEAEKFGRGLAKGDPSIHGLDREMFFGGAKIHENPVVKTTTSSWWFQPIWKY